LKRRAREWVEACGFGKAKISIRSEKPRTHGAAMVSRARADASELNNFHRKAAKAAEGRKGFLKWSHEPG
jgi:hypothetical protein